MDERRTPPLADAERAVALTDLVLGVEAAVFAAGLARGVGGGPSRLRAPLVMSFAATAAASLAGAALHSGFPDHSDPRRRSLWRASLASIGVAAIATWWLGARLVLTGRPATVVEVAALVGHGPYLARVVSGDRPFREAIAAYLPGVAFLTACLVAVRREPEVRPAADLALAAIGVTTVAAVVQVRHVGFGPRFDHNALYHSLQAIGTGLLFGGARRLLAAERTGAAGRTAPTA